MFKTTPSCPIVHCPTWASLQVDEGWWIGEAHGRFGLFPANYVEVPCPFPSTQTHLSHTIYIVHHDHYDRCGNDVNGEDAEVEVEVERRNEAELANIKTFWPVDLYLLCIISFPKHILGKWTIWTMCLASLQTRKGQLSFPTLLAETSCFVSFL